MADAVDIVTQIVEVALKIKDAVETVRRNKEACLQIRRRVERLRQTLSLCENNAELMKDSAVSAVLQELGGILGEALGLVADCQERSFVCLYCTAGKLSRQLGKADQDISNLSSEATLAILAYQMLKQSQDVAHPPPPPARPPPGGVTADQQLSLPREIGQVALEIREAAQTVRQNREECAEIDKRANRIGDLVSRLEKTETTEDPAMSAQLEKLLESFRHARTLVAACQRRNVVAIWPAGKLSKQLREVLDQMELALHDMIAIGVRRASTV